MVSPTHQLTQTTIYADDFQDNTYCFPIDSVLATETAPGKLIISSSEGYLLTTSLSSEPKREQSLPYKKQADGQWSIHGVITLLATKEELDGIVRIQQAQTGTTVLAIQGTSSMLAKLPTPALAISETALSFGQSTLGHSRSLIVSISQQHTDELVTITSYEPDQFQLATDNHPSFTASLQIKPSAIGTYVHVRYLAPKAGVHTGELLVQSSAGEQRIALSGKTVRFRSTRSSSDYTRLRRGRWGTGLKVGVAITATAVVIGLAWIGFTHRNLNSDHTNLNVSETNEKIVPAKPSQDDPTQAAYKPVQTDLTTGEEPSTASNEKRVMAKSTAAKIVSNRKEVTTSRNDRQREESNKMVTQAVEQRPSDRKKSTAKLTEPVVSKRLNPQTRPVQAATESELEKELNQSTPNQP